MVWKDVHVLQMSANQQVTMQQDHIFIKNKYGRAWKKVRRAMY